MENSTAVALPATEQNRTQVPSNSSMSAKSEEKHGATNLFGYEASFSMAIIGTVAHIVLSAIMILQLKRTKAWYFGLLPQAAICGIVACVARIHAILNPGAMTPFVVQKIALGIEPTMVGLAIMFTHTRIIWLVTPNDQRNFKTLGVSPNWITFTWGFAFTLPDMVKGVVSQLGKPREGQKPNLHSLPHRIESVCGVVQIIAIAAYTVWAANFMRKSKSWSPYDKTVKRKNWRLLGWTDVVAALFMTLRIIDITLEFDSRYDREAFLSKHEWTFWVLNALPIIIIYIMYIVVHPGDFLPFAYARLMFNAKTMTKKKLEEEEQANSLSTMVSPVSSNEKTGVSTIELLPASSRC